MGPKKTDTIHVKNYIVPLLLLVMLLSQNSYTQVLGAAGAVSEIEITWFNGTRQVIPVTDGEMNYTIVYPQGEAD